MTLASAANGKLSVVPTANSYFYETFPCQAASYDGYNAITFSVKGPADASFTFEIQTKGSCSASTYQSYFNQVSGLTGVSQTISVPLSSFAGANANAVTGFVWSGFSSLSTTWDFSKVQFACSTVSNCRSRTCGSASFTKIVFAWSVATVESHRSEGNRRCKLSEQQCRHFSGVETTEFVERNAVEFFSSVKSPGSQQVDHPIK